VISTAYTYVRECGVCLPAYVCACVSELVEPSASKCGIINAQNGTCPRLPPHGSGGTAWYGVRGRGRAVYYPGWNLDTAEIICARRSSATHLPSSFHPLKIDVAFSQPCAFSVVVTWLALGQARSDVSRERRELCNAAGGRAQARVGAWHIVSGREAKGSAQVGGGQMVWRNAGGRCRCGHGINALVHNLIKSDKIWAA
jgi:hypothetical protein